MSNELRRWITICEAEIDGPIADPAQIELNLPAPRGQSPRKNKHFWFEPGFNPEIERFILKNPHPCDTGTYCHEDSRRWALFLHDQGIRDVELHSGYYMIGGNPKNTMGHSWVVVNKRIFDPTASQFRGQKSAGNYEESDTYHGEKIRRARIT